MLTTYFAHFGSDERHGSYVVTFPDPDNGATQGESIKEAHTMEQDLLACILNELIKCGGSVPAAKKHRGREFHLVSLPAFQAAKVALYLASRKSRLSKAELSRRVGIAKANVDRLFDLDHASRLDQIESAFHALGKRLEVAVRNAA